MMPVFKRLNIILNLSLGLGHGRPIATTAAGVLQHLQSMTWEAIKDHFRSYGKYFSSLLIEGKKEGEGEGELYTSAHASLQSHNFEEIW